MFNRVRWVNHILLIAIVISVGFHVFIAKEVIFTFKTAKTTHEPLTIFLGSILGKQDLEGYAFSSQDNGALSVETPINLTVDPSGSENRYSSSLRKPNLTPSIAENQKTAYKTPLADSPDDSHDGKKDSLEILGIPDKAPDYKPLQLFINKGKPSAND